MGVHFQALEQPFALAPFVAYVTPISDHYYRGHAAQGRNVEEFLIGFAAGKSLDPWLRRTYAQLRYSYAFVEKVLDQVHDRDNLGLEIGTFITRFEGRNDHRMNRGLTLGLSYGFRPRAEAVLSDAELSEAEEP